MPSPRVFIVHAPEDDAFVREFLVPELGLPPDELLLSTRLELGELLLDEITRGVSLPISIVVCSPAFARSPWLPYAEKLAVHLAIANDAGGTVMIPVLLPGAQPSLISRVVVALDLRDVPADQWPEEVAALRDRLGTERPVAPRSAFQYPVTTGATHLERLPMILAWLRQHDDWLMLVLPLLALAILGLW